jgi:hypothetical protein
VYFVRVLLFVSSFPHFRFLPCLLAGLQYVALSVEALTDTPRWSNILLNREPPDSGRLSHAFLAHVLGADVADADQFCAVEAHYRRTLAARAFHAWAAVAARDADDDMQDGDEDSSGDEKLL